MKVLRRICAVLTMMVLLSGMSAFAVEVDENQGLAFTSREFEMLKACGIIKDTDSFLVPGTDIRRDDFVKLTARLICLDENGSGWRGSFIDVPIDGAHADAIYALKSLGIINGVGELVFRPEKTISYAEACKILVSILGYSVLAEQKYQGYPYGYTIVASLLKLDKNMEGQLAGTLSCEDALTMLYNAANAEMNENYYGTGAETLLGTFHKIYEGKGIVEADRAINFIQYNGVSMNTITINGLRYINSCEEDYLGMSVEFLYRDNEEVSDEIIYISPQENKNQQLEIYYEDLLTASENFKLGSIAYFDGEKEMAAELSQAPQVVYNGQPYEEYDVNTFKIQDGLIRLIDNNSDGSYEFILIEETETISVMSISSDKTIISGRDDRRLKLDEFEMYEFYNSQGAAITAENINAGDILDVAVSKNRKYAVIYQTQEVRNGTVTSVETVGSGYRKYEIGGESYTLSPYAAQALEEMRVGGSYTVYLDKYGRIARYALDKDGYEYAYIINISEMEGGLEPHFLIRMFLESGDMFDARVSEPVKVDGILTDFELFYLDGKLYDNSGVKKQLVKVKFDEYGTLSEVLFSNNVTNPYGYSNNGEFTCDYSSEEATYKGAYMTFDGRYAIDDDTVIFSIPLEEDYEEGDFSIIRASALNPDATYRVSLYESDKNLTAKAAVIREGKTAQYELSFFVVDKLSYVLNEEGDVVRKLTGVSRGREASYYEYEPGIFPADVKNGDVLRVAVKNETVRQVDRVISLQDEQDPFIDDGSTRTRKSVEGYNDIYLGIFGVLYSINSGNLVTLNPDGAEKMLSAHSIRGSNVFVTVYDVRNQLVRVGTIDDVVPSVEPNVDGSVTVDESDTRVLVYRRYGYVREIVLVRY